MNEPSEKELLRREAARYKAEADWLEKLLVEYCGEDPMKIARHRLAARDSLIFLNRRTGCGTPSDL